MTRPRRCRSDAKAATKNSSLDPGDVRSNFILLLMKPLDWLQPGLTPDSTATGLAPARLWRPGGAVDQRSRGMVTLNLTSVVNILARSLCYLTTAFSARFCVSAIPVLIRWHKRLPLRQKAPASSAMMTRLRPSRHGRLSRRIVGASCLSRHASPDTDLIFG